VPDRHTARSCRPHVDIPFYIDALTGSYRQWGHDAHTLGENVDLLEAQALRDAALNAD
jgi:hypothetical protein